MRSLEGEVREAIEHTYNDLPTRIPRASLGKDAQVADAVRLICSLKNPRDGLNLVFCGGTCLSQAYGLIDRMSEDVDFKVLLPAGLSRTTARKRLGGLKQQLVSTMRANGFELIDGSLRGRNENRYITALFAYESAFLPAGALRGSEIKVELTATDGLFEPPSERPLQRIIDRHGHDANSTVDTTPVPVISLADTLAEKTVGFLRRTAQWRAGQGRGDYDEYLVRHLYDVVRMAHSSTDLVTRATPITRRIITQDAKQFENQFPQFTEDNAYRILRDELNQLTGDPETRRRYEELLVPLVYGQAVPYAEAVEGFLGIAGTLINAAEQSLGDDPERALGTQTESPAL